MTADALIRERVSDIPVPEFTSTPCTTAPPLTEARVAIVTTAGLRPAGDVQLGNGQAVAKISDSPGKAMCEDAGYLAYLSEVFRVRQAGADGAG